MTDGAAIAETHRLTAQQWENAYKDLHRKHLELIASMCVLPPKIENKRLVEILDGISTKKPAPITAHELHQLVTCAMKCVYLNEKETNNDAAN